MDNTRKMSTDERSARAEQDHVSFIKNAQAKSDKYTQKLAAHYTDEDLKHLAEAAAELCAINAINDYTKRMVKAMGLLSSLPEFPHSHYAQQKEIIARASVIGMTNALQSWKEATDLVYGDV